MWESGQQTEEAIWGRFRSDDKQLSANVSSPASHPGKSAQLILELMSFSSTTEEEASPGDRLISKKLLKMLLVGLRHRDELTYRHSQRVALLATGIAKYLGWEGEQLQRFEVGSLAS